MKLRNITFGSRQPASPMRLSLLYALLGAVWILINDRLLTSSTDAVAAIDPINILLGLILIAVNSGVLYLLLKTRNDNTKLPPHKATTSTQSPTPFLLAVFVSLLLVAPMFNFGINHIYAAKVEKDAYSDLRLIAEIRSLQLARWVDATRAELESQSNQRYLLQFLANGQSTGNAEQQLDSLLRQYDFSSLSLLDAQGRTLLLRGNKTRKTEVQEALFKEVQRNGKFSRSDFYLLPDGQIQLDLMLPLHNSDQTLLGYLRISTAPHKSILQQVLQWPNVNSSAEALLVKSDGTREQVVHAGQDEIAHALTRPAMTISPYDNTRYPARGYDYHGNFVLAAHKPIEKSSWHIVAQIDKQEVMAPLQALMQFSGVVLMVISIISFFLLLIWRQQRRAYELELMAQSGERDRLLKRFYDLPFFGMAISEPNSKRWIQVNDRLCEILGYERDELLTLSWDDITHPDDIAIDQDYFNQMLIGILDRYGREKRYRRKDGLYIDVKLEVNCLRNADHQVEVVLTTMDDITEAKRAADALRDSEQRLALAFKASRDAWWDVDLITGRPRYSELWASMLGYQPVELPDDPNYWQIITHPEDLPQALQVVSAALNSQESGYQVELRLQHRDGHYVPVMMRGFIVRDPEGTPTRITGANTDLTARKAGEESMRMTTVVFENTREGILVTDADQRIVKINRAFSEISGYSAEEAIGLKPSLVSSGRHGRDFYSQMWHSLNTLGHWQGEIWNRRKNGEIHPELLSITAIKDGTGRVTNYVSIFADISSIKESEAKLEFLAHHDPLTGLPNRLMLISRLNHEIEIAKRNNTLIALMMLDLDRFKNVNDSFGHPAGDALLQQVAERLTARLRSVDTVTRLGGDEFTIVLGGINQPEDAARVAMDIISMIEAPWKLANNIEVRIGASIGISLYPGHGGDAMELLQHADAALYQAKAAGRGCMRFFSESLTKAARERFDIEARLRNALKQNELMVYYQPKVDINTRRIVGAEALVRWQDPKDGLIMPLRFIGIAEETGLVGAIGEFVLRQACRDGRQWLDAGLPPLSIAVNLSTHQLHHSDMLAYVDKVYAETGFPLELLEFELTESVLMQRESEVINTLNKLRSKGISLAIDDFGTGYSSLSYLKSFPLDVLKIDRSFIEDIEKDEDDRAITATIIGMAHTLGMHVVAEGVETKEQLAFLRDHKCDMYQGYLYSPPVPVAQFVEMMRASLASEAVNLEQTG
ncbi:EAL domain-containing protein [Pseudomethylobacillus aquaticus]|uniref:EAL domain-containing protein n=1 Tax=Pseudomethylobacillus aquaticus TaxID=2676064 RepID=A0A3N0V6B4_9PROT|nr:EAL domain-containing protein [Pseudomethylobacillus aquaticus]ROH88309.1 EAL domain-containing protein [Pseudomethylobacillus aquaticus]